MDKILNKLVNNQKACDIVSYVSFAGAAAFTILGIVGVFARGVATGAASMEKYYDDKFYSIDKLELGEAFKKGE